MTTGEYQQFASTGWTEGMKRQPLSVLAMGLAGETGEVLEIFKKSIRDNKPIDLEHLYEELGDVFWYLANLCTLFSISVESVMEKNIKKLERRYAQNET